MAAEKEAVKLRTCERPTDGGPCTLLAGHAGACSPDYFPVHS
jgi:hypothetical protein